MDAQARRQRRQERINANAKDRLAKIMGRPVGDDELPASAREDISEKARNANQDDPEVSELPSEDAFGAPTDVEQEKMRQEFMQMMQQFSGQSAAGDNAQIPLPNPEMDPFAMLNQMMGAGSGPGLQPVDLSEAPRTKTNGILWRLVHVVTCVSLGLYVVFVAQEPSYFGYYFCSLQLALHLARFTMGGGHLPAHSMVTKISGFVPPPFNAYLLNVSRYLKLASDVLADFCLAFFTVMLSSGAKSQIG